MTGVPLLAYAGGGSGGSTTHTFGAYQVDFNTGPVGIKIQGRSAAEVVRIDEQNIPSNLKVDYSEQGGILTVTVSDAAAGTKAAKPVPAGTLYATMPRYEFVHLATGSGNVTIDNLSTDHLTIKTREGDINVTNTNAALKASSTTGNQRYGQLYGALDASSTSGSMSVSHTWGVMNLESQSGSLNGVDVALAGKNVVGGIESDPSQHG